MYPPPDGLGGMSLQTAPTWKNNSKTEGLASIVQFELYAHFKAHNAKVVKPFKAIPEKVEKDLIYNKDSLY